LDCHIKRLLVKGCAVSVPQAVQGVVLGLTPEIIEIFVDRVVGTPVISASNPVSTAVFKKLNDFRYDFFLLFLGLGPWFLLEPADSGPPAPRREFTGGSRVSS